MLIATILFKLPMYCFAMAITFLTPFVRDCILFNNYFYANHSIHNTIPCILHLISRTISCGNTPFSIIDGSANNTSFPPCQNDEKILCNYGISFYMALGDDILYSTTWQPQLSCVTRDLILKILE